MSSPNTYMYVNTKYALCFLSGILFSYSFSTISNSLPNLKTLYLTKFLPDPRNTDFYGNCSGNLTSIDRKDCGICFDQLGLDIEPTVKFGVNFPLKRIKESDLPTKDVSETSMAGGTEVPVSRFPKALIVGFGKCGTSALLHFLSLHPDVVTVDWEVDFFCDRHYYNYPLLWYRKVMPPSYQHQVTIEKSTCYIRCQKHIERIKAFNSSIKLIIVLRDPVRVLLSKYGQIVKDGKASYGQPSHAFVKENGDLRTAFIDKWGIYVEGIAAVLSLLPRKQIFIVDGDGFITNPLTQLADAERFLGIRSYFSEADIGFDESTGFFCPRYRDTGQTHCLGHSKGRSQETIGRGLETRLRKYLKPFNEELFFLIQQRFDWNEVRE